MQSPSYEETWNELHICCGRGLLLELQNVVQVYFFVLAF
uniref:Uncharacterized protein n=1 Tax=Brassica oleracea TaxID=3712 RepID=A0A3P6DVZ5_BRAOL|nr:unnamed protein product [Brassica oleracea]